MSQWTDAPPAGCLGDEQFVAWQAHSLAPDALRAAVDHTAICERCRAILAEVARTADLDESRLGRYEILEPLGSGGMGLVLRAYDPLLNREVAIKVCRDGHASAAALAKPGLLLEEARTLARVRHANVVPVFDVGMVDGEVYIAMELVEGASLSEWSATSKPLEDRRRIAIDIGRGLSAMHQIGLLHRDLKPGNVMVREDGTAVIVDLGLAMEGGNAAGKLAVGTQGYIPPEVSSGSPFTVQSDQYQWGIVMRDALRLADASPALAKTIARMSKVDPKERYPSIDAALATFAPEPSSSLGSILTPLRIGTAVTVAIAVIVAIALWPTKHGNDDKLGSEAIVDSRCEDRVGWSESTKGKVVTNLDAMGAKTSEIVPWIDARAQQAQQLSREFCYQALAGNEVASRRKACVSRAWRETVSIILQLRDGDREAVYGGIDGLAALLDLVRCEGGTVLAVPEPLTPEVARAGYNATTAMRAAIADAALGSDARQATLEALRDELAALGQPLVLARWHEELAEVLLTQGDIRRASEELGVAYAFGMEAGDDQFCASALVNQLANTPADVSEDARKQLYNHAHAAVERVGNAFWASQLEGALAKQYLTAGDSEGATKHYRSAIETLRSLRFQPHRMELAMMQNLGLVLLESGNAEAASTLLSEAVAMGALRYTDEQAPYWDFRTAKATALLSLRDYQAAADELSAVSAGLAAAALSKHSQGIAESYLSLALGGIKKTSESYAAAEKAIALVEEVAGEHPALVLPLLSAAQAALAISKAAVALAHLRRIESLCESGSCREIERVTKDAYLAIALKQTGSLALAEEVATSVAEALSVPGLEKARQDLLAAFPKLRDD